MQMELVSETSGRHGPKRGPKHVPSPPPDSRLCVSASRTHWPGRAHEQQHSYCFPSETTRKKICWRLSRDRTRHLHTYEHSNRRLNNYSTTNIVSGMLVVILLSLEEIFSRFYSRQPRSKSPQIRDAFKNHQHGGVKRQIWFALLHFSDVSVK